jgi:Flp pilus assembly protein TadD
MEATAMSKTLKIVDHLLARGKNQLAMGRHRDALATLEHVTRLPQVGRETLLESNLLQGEIHLQQNNHLEARRHFRVTLTYDYTNARFHYLMAQAHELDLEKGDPVEAGRHYRESLRIDNQQPECLSDFGMFALSQGDEEEGIQALRRAVDLSPDDPEIVGKLVEGLLQLYRNDEARLTLRAARFRNPRHPGFAKLWSDFEFQLIREEQFASYELLHPGTTLDQPTILPFRPGPRKSAVKASGRKIIRRDGPSSPTPPHSPRRSRVQGKRHA